MGSVRDNFTKFCYMSLMLLGRYCCSFLILLKHKWFNEKSTFDKSWSVIYFPFYARHVLPWSPTTSLQWLSLLFRSATTPVYLPITTLIIVLLTVAETYYLVSFLNKDDSLIQFVLILAASGITSPTCRSLVLRIQSSVVIFSCIYWWNPNLSLNFRHGCRF